MNAILLIDFGSTYTKLTAVDIDAEQILGTASAYTTVETDINEGLANALAQLQQQKYDLVLVNIVADVIIALAPVLPKFLEPSSTLICSGILDTRLADVTKALTAAGLLIENTYAKEDWRCITAKRRVL